MNKIYVIVLLALFPNANLFAQENSVVQPASKPGHFYLRGGFDYALVFAGQTYGPTGRYSGTQELGFSSFNLNIASFGTGLHGCLSFGYMFNKNMGVELNGDIGIVNTKYTLNVSDYSFSVPANNYNITTSYQARTPFILSPSLFLQTSGKRWNFFSCVGVALPLSHKIDLSENELIYSSNTTNVYHYTAVLQTKFSIGMKASVGVTYDLSDKLKLSAGVSVLALSLFIKELDNTGSTLNGQNYTSPSGQTNISYGLSGNGYTASTTNSIPFSNLAFNAGICYSFKRRK